MPSWRCARLTPRPPALPRCRSPASRRGACPTAAIARRSPPPGITDAAGNPLAGRSRTGIHRPPRRRQPRRARQPLRLQRLASRFGSTTRSFHEGDFNYDGIVNLADFNILATNFGVSLESATGDDSSRPPSDNTAADELEDLLAGPSPSDRNAA